MAVIRAESHAPGPGHCLIRSYSGYTFTPTPLTEYSEEVLSGT